MKKRVICIVYYLFVVVTLSLGGCKGKTPAQEVVIYTSLDKVFSQPVLEAFEKETNIKVLPVYGSEATKTTGPVNRLIAEKSNPRANISWDSGICRTIALKQKGVSAKYVSPSASDIPEQFKDRDSYHYYYDYENRIVQIRGANDVNVDTFAYDALRLSSLYAFLALYKRYILKSPP